MFGSRPWQSAWLTLIVVGGTSGCTSTPGGSLRAIEVAGAPNAPDPCAQGIVANGFVHAAGQTPRGRHASPRR